MPEKFQNKYRIESTRLQSWDYGWNGAYFVTMVTHDRKNYFGEIENGKMIKSELGLILNDEWLKTPHIRPDMNIILDEYCVMPDHFHAIIIIERNQYNEFDNKTGNKNPESVDGLGDGAEDRGAMHRASTPRPTPSPKNPGNPRKNQFGPQRKNLSSIIRGFKSAVTTYARKNNIEFAWQSNYHDHIIRNDTEFIRIKNYIKNNPSKWTADKSNKE